MRVETEITVRRWKSCEGGKSTLGVNEVFVECEFDIRKETCGIGFDLEN